MTPDQIASLNIPSDPRLSPDGTRVAFVVSTPNLEDDRYDRSIWVEHEQFTTGPGDSAPRWSLDGGKLAFLREIDEVSQVAIIPADGGEARVVTSFERGVEALEWSPSGDRLVVVAVTFVEEWAGLDDEERSRRARRIASVPYRFDTRAGGWTHDRKRHLWLIDPKGEAEPTCLTPGDHDEEFPAWAPRGNRVAFISDRSPQLGLVPDNDVWEVDVDTGEISQITDGGMWTFVSYSPDGTLHLLGNTDATGPVESHLYRREDDGTLTNLTSALDRSSVSLAAGPAAIRWDDGTAVVGLEDSGRFGLVGVATDGTVDNLVRGDRVVTGFDAADGRLTYTASSWDSPGEVISDGTPLTDLNSADLDLAVPDHFQVNSDGHEIDVWVYMPEGDSKVPLLLNIHGGPASQYGFGFFDEFQVFAGAGYGVVACNPRGSSGRGRDFLRAVVGEGWGQVDHTDIKAAVDEAMRRHGRLDADRMGIMGGSYGGFMTAWIIGKEDRWKSAVVERALTSWTSFSGTSDIGGTFPEKYTGEAYPDAWDTWWRLSPMALAHNVTTPTLVLHSENDFRCPIEQAEQYFMALLRNGTTTEFLRFPGEGHELTRSGKPRHRVERFEAIIEWHGRHLQ